MVLLVYSERCKYCSEIITYIQSHHALLSVVRFHNINTHGVPNGLTRVPTLVAENGISIVGGDIRNYLENLIPSDVESSSLGSRLTSTSIDGSVSFDNFFTTDSFGTSLAPPMTPELEEKIKKNVQDAYQSIKT